MPLYLNIYEKSSKQITFEDMLEDNFFEDKLDKLDPESEKTKRDKYSGLSYYAVNHISSLGFNNNNYEYSQDNFIRNGLHDTAWDFNKDFFFYGMKYLGEVGSSVICSTSNKIQVLANDINIIYKKQNMTPKDKFLNFIEEVAMKRMSRLIDLNYCENHIIDIKSDNIDDEFVEILSVQSIYSDV
jgi:hypothetical protein